MMSNILKNEMEFEEKQNQFTVLKETVEKDTTITDKQRKKLIVRINY